MTLYRIDHERATAEDVHRWLMDELLVPVELDYEAAFEFNQRRDVQYMDEVVEMVNLAVGEETP